MDEELAWNPLGLEAEELAELAPEDQGSSSGRLCKASLRDADANHAYRAYRAYRASRAVPPEAIARVHCFGILLG
eukprot:Skav234201  [mRNA]  locus=scaffold2795:27969:29700:+ [translate_table: standard]